MKLGHIAVFTENMDKSIEFYKLLGGKVGMRSLLNCGNGVTKDLVHMVFDGDATVELVAANKKEIMTFNTGVCEHFCFDVENVDETVKELKAKGIDTFDKEEPYNLDIFGGIRIIFLTGPSGEMIELFQKL